MFAIFKTLGCVSAKPPHYVCMPMHTRTIVDSLILLNYNFKF